MNIRSLVSLVTIALTLSCATTSALSQNSDSNSATPMLSKVTTLTIRCDAGKTTVVQNRIVGDAGTTSAVIAVTTELGNIYTVAFQGNKAIAQTIKRVEGTKAEPSELGVWLFLVEIESPNYMLLARRQPNDCMNVK